MWRRARGSHRLVAFLLLSVYSVSCSFSSWKPQQAPPEQVLTARHPDHVRVVTAAADTLELWNPRISGDSLVGSRSRVAAGTEGAPTGLPLSEVAWLEARSTNTGLVIAAAGLTALMVAAIIAYQTSDDVVELDEPVYSCPLVYSWDGQCWRLDSGTFGGAIMPALARTEVDNLMYLQAERDSLRLRVTNELNEIDYLDQIAVLAVDHDPRVGVAPDGRGGLHSVGGLTPPAAARDFRGVDALARIVRSDGWAWESKPTRRDSSVAAQVRDGLEVRFPRPSGAGHARLVVDASNTAWAEDMMGRFVGLHGSAARGWYDSVAAYPDLAAQLGRMMSREIYLGVWVYVNGRWERRGTVTEAGPEVWKRQVVPLDLTGTTGDVLRVRLESAPSLWLVDQLAMDYSAPTALQVRELRPVRATDDSGGDVLALVADADRRELVLQRGDSAEVVFAAPPLASGRARSYLLSSRGWYHLQVPESGAPQTALLDAALDEPLAASRIVTGTLTRALGALDAGSK
jgi:hypothetical protein